MSAVAHAVVACIRADAREDSHRLCARLTTTSTTTAVVYMRARINNASPCRFEEDSPTNIYETSMAAMTSQLVHKSSDSYHLTSVGSFKEKNKEYRESVTNPSFLIDVRHFSVE